MTLTDLKQKLSGASVSYQVNERSKVNFIIEDVDFHTEYYIIRLAGETKRLHVPHRYFNAFVEGKAIKYEENGKKITTQVSKEKPLLSWRNRYDCEQRWWHLYCGMVERGEKLEEAAAKADKAIAYGLGHTNGIFK